MARPIDTMVIEVRLIPRRRSGRQIWRSNPPAMSAEAAMPNGAASRRWMFGPDWLSQKATRAPMVTISPWAKFVRPVVP